MWANGITAAVFPRCGRFFAPADREFQNGVEPVRDARFADSSESSGSRPRVSAGIRGLPDGGAARAVSHEFQQGSFLFQPFACVLTAVFHEQQNGLAQACNALRLGVALAVGLGNFGAKGHEPFAVAMNLCCQRHVHSGNMTRNPAATQEGVSPPCGMFPSVK